MNLTFTAQCSNKHQAAMIVGSVWTNTETLQPKHVSEIQNIQKHTADITFLAPSVSLWLMISKTEDSSCKCSQKCAPFLMLFKTKYIITQTFEFHNVFTLMPSLGFLRVLKSLNSPFHEWRSKKILKSQHYIFSEFLFVF